ncbi:MAG TPA: disulfide bond formation protein B [Pseudomonas sp.]|nr:disulfide bond formation protein B [Pseudomonas sp.]
MFHASSRTLFLVAFLGSVLVMLAALYLEHGVGLEPCPLCILQRVAVIGFGLVCLIAAVHGPARTGQRVYAALALLMAGAGAGVAGRQIWLQQVPTDQLPACLPSLDYMLEALPFREVLSLMLYGSADCAKITWTLFGISIPEWSLLGFIGMLLFSAYLLLRRR